MEFINALLGNYVINVSVLSWLVAQIIKTVLAYIPNKRVNWERLVGAGGMPSSHSAFVCSTAVAIAKKAGYASPEFALAIVFAAVVMYDAMGVRRAAGEQAKVLNKMVIDFRDVFDMLKEEVGALANGRTDEDDSPDDEENPKRLKEFLGHTPLEVLCGAILGILIAALIPVR